MSKREPGRAKSAADSAVDIAVDIAAGVVRVGEQQWPFDLDLHAGAAVLWVGAQAVRVRPLLWREKMMLARFAHLGPSFVQQHFLRLALAGRPLPSTAENEAESKTEDEAVTAALVALAQWIDSSGAARARVPLDPVRLGQVALAVCRGAGLRPADLDARPAAEVELLWQAMQQAGPGEQAEPVAHAAPAAAEDDGQVRILIVPDPAPAQPDRSTGAAQPASPRPAQPEPSPGRAPTLSPEAEPGTDAERLALGSDAPPVPRAAMPAPQQAAPVDARAAPPLPKRQAALFRLFYPTLEARGSRPTATPWPPAQPLDAAPAQVARGPVQEPAAPDKQRVAAPRVPLSGRGKAARPAIPAPGAAGVSAHPQMPASLAQPSTSSTYAAEPDLAGKDDSDGARLDWELLLEELSERLAQAAAELGIDLEG